MKLGLSTMLAAAGTVMLVTVSLADVPLPTTVTVFFQKDGKPYHKPVDFNVRCYGWASYPGEPGFPPGRKPEPYTPKEVYSFSGRCSDYGCAIHHDLYLNYKTIDYCDIEGKLASIPRLLWVSIPRTFLHYLSEGRSFKVEKFGSNPVGTCPEPKGGSSFAQRCELRITLPE